MTYNSVLNSEIKEEKKKSENFTVQMEVNIAKIIKNPGNAKINLHQTNIVSGRAVSNDKVNQMNDTRKEEIIKEEASKKVS